MFGSQILDVLIGLASVFLLLSLVATAVREAVEAGFKTRAIMLERGIRELLGDRSGTGMVADFYRHPLIASLYQNDFVPVEGLRRLGRNLPTYIPTKNFSAALLDFAIRGRAPSAYAAAHTDPIITIDALREGVARLPSAQLQHALLTAIDDAKGDIAAVRTNLERWFDSTMDRVSGWYKRRTQLWLLVIGTTLAGALNVNTIEIANHLWKDKSARAALVGTGELLANDPSYNRATGDSASMATRVPPAQTLASLDLPIGWDHLPVRDAAHTNAFDYWLRTVVGILVTALAVTLGAPFWFDALNKMMVIRSTVKPHEKSPEEGSEDRKGRTPIHVNVNGTTVDATAAAPQQPAQEQATRTPSPAMLLAASRFEAREWTSGDPDEGVL